MGVVDFGSSRRRSPWRIQRGHRSELHTSRPHSPPMPQNEAEHRMGLCMNAATGEYDTIDTRFSATTAAMALALKTQAKRRRKRRRWRNPRLQRLMLAPETTLISSNTFPGQEKSWFEWETYPSTFANWRSGVNGIHRNTGSRRCWQDGLVRRSEEAKV